MAVELRDDFLFGEWIELFEEYDRRARVFPLFPFSLQFVADFAAADQDAFGFPDSRVGNYIEETLVREIFNRRTRVGVTQHALWRKNYQWLAPMTQGLPT